TLAPQSAQDVSASRSTISNYQYLNEVGWEEYRTFCIEAVMDTSLSYRQRHTRIIDHDQTDGISNVSTPADLHGVLIRQLFYRRTMVGSRCKAQLIHVATGQGGFTSQRLVQFVQGGVYRQTGIVQHCTVLACCQNMPQVLQQTVRDIQCRV